MKSFLLGVLLFLYYLPGNSHLVTYTANTRQSKQLITSPGQQLADKIFPLFSELAADSMLSIALQEDALLARCRKRYTVRVAHCLDTCTSAYSLAQSLKWREEEIDSVLTGLLTLYNKKMCGSGFILRLKKSRTCIAYEHNDAKALLQQAWHDAARGMNRIYDVYIAAVPPYYAAIDSIMTDVRSESGLKRLCDTIRNTLMSHENTRAFYALPVSCAIKALLLSARDEAIRYEPIVAGINKEAYQQVARVRFSDYQYAAILVPGFGPEIPGLNIDPRSIKRCEMAAEQYRKKLAPFIIVSGGHVYPAGTPFSEAVEMKKYLVERLGIPPGVIITEPYARHTTTNVRNAARLVYLFGLRENKPVLVSTDSLQTQMVINLAARCKRELGYVPFRNVKQLGTTASSFYPVAEAFQVNVKDPLDP